MERGRITMPDLIACLRELEACAPDKDTEAAAKALRKHLRAMIESLTQEKDL